MRHRNGIKKVTGRPGRWLAVQSGYSNPFLLGLNQFYQTETAFMENELAENDQIIGAIKMLSLARVSNLSFVICNLSSVIVPMPSHHYSLTTVWTGNTGKGTAGYRDYERSYEVRIPQKPVLLGSSDPKFRGDPARYNPEDLLVASLSACHMLWYLHLCSDQKVICTHYSDAAEGEMEMTANGAGRFTKVVLHPEIVITSDAGVKAAHELHERAHALCFIANSVNFPVEVSPTIRVES
ncbi:MAG TPA: OsmC family protein [Chthoniobacterales bacterium]|nr:OsmC family protein [Chthoniobacterales bacterium]